MKFKKPPAWIELPIDIRDFLHSLPDSFEIVPEGHVCVRWPRELTRDVLKDAAEYINYRLDSESSIKVVEYLETLAAIAPGPRNRKADLWKHTSGQKMWVYPDDNWHPTNIGWRKVGECEVDA